MKAAVLIITLFAGTLSAQEAFTTTQLEMHKAHSEHRAKNGLAPQRLDAGLCRLAQALAEAQQRAGYMAHATGWPFAYGENCAMGATPTGAIQAWVASSGHNVNLLSTHPCVGFGYAGIYAASLHANSYRGDTLQVTLRAKTGSTPRMRVFRFFPTIRR